MEEEVCGMDITYGKNRPSTLAGNGMKTTSIAQIADTQRGDVPRIDHKNYHQIVLSIMSQTT